MCNYIRHMDDGGAIFIRGESFFYDACISNYKETGDILLVEAGIIAKMTGVPSNEIEGIFKITGRGVGADGGDGYLTKLVRVDDHPVEKELDEEGGDR